MFNVEHLIAMKAKARRNDLDVLADLIEVARAAGGATKTRLVYGANLNWRLIKVYLVRMLTSGLLVLRDGRYHATPKADLYLERYRSLGGLLAL